MGSSKKDELKSRLIDEFKYWKKTHENRTVEKDPKSRKKPTSVQLYIDYAKIPSNKLTEMYIVYDLPGITKDKVLNAKADLMSSILNDSTSLLNSQLKQIEGVKRFYTFSSSKLKHSYLAFCFLVNQNDVEKTAKQVIERIKAYKNNKIIKTKELEQAKVNIKEEWKSEILDNSKYIQLLSKCWSISGLDYCNNYLNTISTIERDEIEQFFDTHIKKKHPISGVTIDETYKYSTN